MRCLLVADSTNTSAYMYVVLRFRIDTIARRNATIYQNNVGIVRLKTHYDSVLLFSTSAKPRSMHFVCDPYMDMQTDCRCPRRSRLDGVVLGCICIDTFILKQS